MRKVSLVISDVDGTVVTHDKALTARAIAAVERLHEAGIGFSICSSRPPFGLRMLIEPLRLTLPFGGYNTGAIVEPDLSVIEQKLILPDVAKQAVSLFQQHHIDCWVFVGNEWLITNPQGDHVERETHTIQTPPTVVPAFDDSHFAAVGKIVGPSKDHTLIARLTDLMQTALDDRASVGRSQPYYCDVIPPGIDKGRLVEFLARCLDVPQPEILVLGDMENDLAMFRRAGFAIAMGNASDDVKCAAHATTPSISSTSRSGRSSSSGEPRGNAPGYESGSWRAYAAIKDEETAKELAATIGEYGVLAWSEGQNSGTHGKAFEIGSRSRGRTRNLPRAETSADPPRGDHARYARGRAVCDPAGRTPAALRPRRLLPPA